MTTGQVDITTARTLAKECREDDERMTPGEWREGIAGACNVVHFDGDDIRGVLWANGANNRAAIASTRNRLPLLASTLDALADECERLREALRRACDIAERCHGPECKWGDECQWNASGEIDQLRALADKEQP